VNEIKGIFNDVLIISELRGGFPDVKIAGDVDYAGLTADDPNPVFLTLPIGKAGVTSGNKRHYDEPWLQELEKQTLANKPIGLMGHLSETDRDHAMPTEAIHWVGVQRVGDVLWGKGYVPPGEARQRIQRYKAQGKKIATSIDAYAEGVWENGLGAYRMTPASMRLNQIDIAPADRAGIADLAGVPILSKEMNASAQSEQRDKQEVNQPMDKLQVINEMTVEDARLLPATVRAAIEAAVPTPAEVKLVTELRQALGVDDKADLVKMITEMTQERATQAKAAITGRIKEVIEHKDTGIKLEKMRPVVTELIAARNPQTVAEVDAAYTAVCALPSIKELLGAEVVKTMGPAQTAPLGDNGKPAAASWYSIPAEDAH
jgi:hypothetical protein